MQNYKCNKMPKHILNFILFGDNSWANTSIFAANIFTVTKKYKYFVFNSAFRWKSIFWAQVQYQFQVFLVTSLIKSPWAKCQFHFYFGKWMRSRCLCLIKPSTSLLSISKSNFMGKNKIFVNEIENKERQSKICEGKFQLINYLLLKSIFQNICTKKREIWWMQWNYRK